MNSKEFDQMMKVVVTLKPSPENGNVFPDSHTSTNDSTESFHQWTTEEMFRSAIRGHCPDALEALAETSLHPRVLGSLTRWQELGFPSLKFSLVGLMASEWLPILEEKLVAYAQANSISTTVNPQ